MSKAQKIGKIVVIDGETFRCDFEGETCTILLHGVDAPNVDDPLSKELTKLLRELIVGKEKEIDLEMTGISLGELVCIVWAGGKSVNKQISSYLKMKQASKLTVQG